jgi:hypothetical protein
MRNTLLYFCVCTCTCAYIDACVYSIRLRTHCKAHTQALKKKKEGTWGPIKASFFVIRFTSIQTHTHTHKTYTQKKPQKYMNMYVQALTQSLTAKHMHREEPARHTWRVHLAPPRFDLGAHTYYNACEHVSGNGFKYWKKTARHTWRLHLSPPRFYLGAHTVQYTWTCVWNLGHTYCNAYEHVSGILGHIQCNNAYEHVSGNGFMYWESTAWQRWWRFQLLSLQYHFQAHTHI